MSQPTGPSSDAFAIGDLAKQTDTKIETIRYYERIGLLRSPTRTASGYRKYGSDDIARLRFVRRGRALGFSLDAIRELIALAEDSRRDCSEVNSVAHVHLADVEEKIARLTAMRAELSRLIAECGGGRMATCRLIETLSAPTPR